VSQPAISVAPDITHYFQGVLTEAIQAREVEATPAAERYIVMLLCDYARPDETAEVSFEQPLTLLLRDAMSAEGAARFQLLRKLGDGLLYALGFFSARVERTADRTYVLNVGATAYTNAAQMIALRSPQRAQSGRAKDSIGASGSPDVLRELADKYEAFVNVLSDVSDKTMASSQSGEQGALRLYERWLQTGSAVLAQELAARGIVPTRPTGGVN
jgi:hypothetical protein